MKRSGLLMIALLWGFSLLAQDKVKVNCVKEESSITYVMNHPLHAWKGEAKRSAQLS